MQKKIFITTFLLLFVFSFVSAGVAYAQDDDMLGVNYASYVGTGQADVRTSVAAIINAALGFLGIGALGLLIYSGFTWTTSMGNQDKVDKAKKTIYYTMIGLAIILSAYAITRFVLITFYHASTGYFMY